MAITIKAVKDHQGVTYYKVFGTDPIVHPSAIPNLFRTRAEALKFVRYAKKELAKSPQSIPNGRMGPARIRHKGKTYPGKVKRVNGRVKIFVTPQVARKINPGETRFRVMAGPHIALHASTLKGAKKLVAGLLSRGMVYGRLVTIYDEDLKR